MQHLVTRSVEIKADIVSRDERATGERIVLNYGHTFGHAIDLVSGQLEDQGESVALGMMAAAHLARRQGRIDDDVVDRHRRLLSSLGLPTSGRSRPGLDAAAWLRDKKYRHGVRFVVLNGLGQAETDVTASDDVLAEVLDDLASSLREPGPAGHPGNPNSRRGVFQRSCRRRRVRTILQLREQRPVVEAYRRSAGTVKFDPQTQLSGPEGVDEGPHERPGVLVRRRPAGELDETRELDHCPVRPRRRRPGNPAHRAPQPGRGARSGRRAHGPRIASAAGRGPGAGPR